MRVDAADRRRPGRGPVGPGPGDHGRGRVQRPDRRPGAGGGAGGAGGVAGRRAGRHRAGGAVGRDVAEEVHRDGEEGRGRGPHRHRRGDRAEVRERTGTWLEIDRANPALAIWTITGPTEQLVAAEEACAATVRGMSPEELAGRTHGIAKVDLITDALLNGGAGPVSVVRREVGVVIHLDTLDGQGPAAQAAGEVRGTGHPVPVTAAVARVLAADALARGAGHLRPAGRRHRPPDPRPPGRRRARERLDPSRSDRGGASGAATAAAADGTTPTPTHPPPRSPTPSTPATRSAPSPAAASRPAGATSTTSSRTRADPPPCTTSARDPAGATGSRPRPCGAAARADHPQAPSIAHEWTSPLGHRQVVEVATLPGC